MCCIIASHSHVRAATEDTCTHDFFERDFLVFANAHVCYLYGLEIELETKGVDRARSHVVERLQMRVGAKARPTRGTSGMTTLLRVIGIVLRANYSPVISSRVRHAVIIRVVHTNTNNVHRDLPHPVLQAKPHTAGAWSEQASSVKSCTHS